MSKRVKTAIILVATALLLALGVYLFFQPVHVPVWMTYPYDVTIQAGGAKINYYLSEEKEINIPDRIWGAEVRYIAEDAFSILGTDAIILEVPNHLDIEELYHYESHSYYKVFDDSAWMIKYVGNERKIEIPEEVWGRKVTCIARNCFLDLDVEEVVIPETVTHIGERAFKGCKNLKHINFPTCLEYIGAESFEAAGLEKIEFSENIVEIASGAFAYSAAKEITGIEYVENIGNWAFRGTPWEESMEGAFQRQEDGS